MPSGTFNLIVFRTPGAVTKAVRMVLQLDGSTNTAKIQLQRLSEQREWQCRGRERQGRQGSVAQPAWPISDDRHYGQGGPGE